MSLGNAVMAARASACINKKKDGNTCGSMTRRQIFVGEKQMGGTHKRKRPYFVEKKVHKCMSCDM